MFYFLKEKIRFSLARCPNLKVSPREGWRSPNQRRDHSLVIVDNRPDKAHQERVFNALIRCNLPHMQRLSPRTPRANSRVAHQSFSAFWKYSAALC
jgi:hypothetical protein